jgi:hypothetical protein
VDDDDSDNKEDIWALTMCHCFSGKENLLILIPILRSKNYYYFHFQTRKVRNSHKARN